MKSSGSGEHIPARAEGKDKAVKKYEYAGRQSLSNGRRGRKEINMPYVYKQIDAGRSIKDIAGELGVSVRTLNRRHKEYQESMKAKAEE